MLRVYIHQTLPHVIARPNDWHDPLTKRSLIVAPKLAAMPSSVTLAMQALLYGLLELELTPGSQPLASPMAQRVAQVPLFLLQALQAQLAVVVNLEPAL